MNQKWFEILLPFWAIAILAGVTFLLVVATGGAMLVLVMIGALLFFPLGFYELGPNQPLPHPLEITIAVWIFWYSIYVLVLRTRGLEFAVTVSSFVAVTLILLQYIIPVLFGYTFAQDVFSL